MRRRGPPQGDRPNRDDQQWGSTGSLLAALSGAGEDTPSPEEAAACASTCLPGFQAARLGRAGSLGGRPWSRLQAARDRQSLGACLQGLGSARSCGDRSRGPPDRPTGPCPAGPEPRGQEEFAGNRHLVAKRLRAVRAELALGLRLLSERLSHPDGDRLSSQVAWGSQLAAGALPVRRMLPRSSGPLGRPHRMSFSVTISVAQVVVAREIPDGRYPPDRTLRPGVIGNTPASGAGFRGSSPWGAVSSCPPASGRKSL